VSRSRTSTAPNGNGHEYVDKAESADLTLLRVAIESMSSHVSNVVGTCNKILGEQLRVAQREEKILKLIEARDNHLDRLTLEIRDLCEAVKRIEIRIGTRPLPGGG
jgi:phage shock protein A